MTERTETESSRETLQRYREVAAGVIGFIRGQEVTRSYTSLSLEELIDRRIERIEQPSTGGRPGALARLEALKADFAAAIDGMKETPPGAYRTADPTTDANTADTEGT